jgi:hypothetical protein
LDPSKDKRIAELIANSLLLLIFVWFACKAFYELFIFEEGKHYPRVGLSYNTWGNAVVDFTLNIPTVTAIIILLAALISMYASVWIYLIRIFAWEKKTKKYWIMQLTGFLICLTALIIGVLDFFNTAFQGVG